MQRLKKSSQFAGIRISPLLIMAKAVIWAWAMAWPAPISTIAAHSPQYGASALSWTVNSANPVSAVAIDTGTSRPGGTRSTIRPATCIAVPEPSANGMPSSPATVAVSPRTTCRYRGSSSIVPK